MAYKYDPNCETTNLEKVVAGHWELLRRNEEFQKLSRLWLQSEVFRKSHALSPDYHDLQHHTPGRVTPESWQHAKKGSGRAKWPPIKKAAGLPTTAAGANTST